MSDDLPTVDEENRWAHSSGRLEWGMWMCGCDACREVCRRLPGVLMVIKGSHERRFVNAGQLADGDPEEFLADGWVREIFVAQVQPSPKGWPRPPSPVLRHLQKPVGEDQPARPGVSGFQP